MAHSSRIAEPGPTLDRTSVGGWVRVGVLLLATFTVVTSEMVAIGLLTPIAATFDAPAGMIGLGLTITGLVVAGTAPVVPKLVGRLDRRAVIIAALLVLASGNVIAATAESVSVFLVSRVALGFGIAGVWSLAGVVATRLVAQRHAALAVTIAVSGVAAASVIGIPLGIALGTALGWRSVFAGLAACSVVVAVAILLSYPRLPRIEHGPSRVVMGGSDRLARAALTRGFAFILVLVSAQFAAYSYVRPVLERSGFDAAGVALALFAYGIAGLVGNFMAGALAARRPRRTVISIAAIVFIVLVTLAFVGATTTVSFVTLIIWGLGYGGLSVAGQIWLTRAAPGREEHVTAVYVGLFNAAIAAGSLIGGMLIAAGITVLLGVAALLAGAAVIIGATGPNPRLAKTPVP